MIRIKLRKNRYHWKALAAANFFLGGLGAGLFIFHWFVSFWVFDQMNPTGDRFIPLICAFLVVLGFGAVALEAGRPLRGIYVVLNFATAWMSREVVFGWLFVLLCIAHYLFQSAVIAHFAALSAGLFVLSQAMVLYCSQAITNWHTYPMPALLISADFCAGYGACLLLGLISLPMLMSGIFIIGIHMLLSAFYLHHTNANGAMQPIGRQPNYYKSLMRNDAFGLWVPFVLTLMLLSGAFSDGTFATAVCGLFSILGIGYKSYNIVCKSVNIRPITIEKPSPETVCR